MKSAPFSAIIRVAAFVLPDTVVGILKKRHLIMNVIPVLQQSYDVRNIQKLTLKRQLLSNFECFELAIYYQQRL